MNLMQQLRCCLIDFDLKCCMVGQYLEITLSGRSRRKGGVWITVSTKIEDGLSIRSEYFRLLSSIRRGGYQASAGSGLLAFFQHRAYGANFITYPKTSFS